MRVEIGPAVARILGCSEETLAVLDKTLTFSKSEYQRWTKRWIARPVPVYERLPGGGRVIPVGLVSRVLRAAKGLRIEPEVLRKGWAPLPQPEAIPEVLKDGKPLYPDQVEAIRVAVGQQRGLLDLPVNFGKTRVIGGVCLAWPRAPAVVLYNRAALASQVQQDLQELTGERVGLWIGGHHEQRRITVGTVQSRPPVKDAQLLFADEVHTVSIKQWFPTLVACPAPVRIGLSGSVKEAETLLVESFFGEVLMRVKDQDLVAQGRSAQATVLMPWCSVEGYISKDYEIVYDRGVVHSEKRNALFTTFTAEAHKHGLPSVLMVYRIDHGKLLQAKLHALGLHSRWLYGETPLRQIEEAKRDFEEGRLSIAIVGTSFNQGHNLPSIRFLANAAAWRSELATGQKFGRGVRLKPWGDNVVTILDPMDLGHSTLENHAKDRSRLYARKGCAVREGKAAELLALVG